MPRLTPPPEAPGSGRVPTAAGCSPHPRPPLWGNELDSVHLRYEWHESLLCGPRAGLRCGVTPPPSTWPRMNRREQGGGGALGICVRCPGSIPGLGRPGKCTWVSISGALLTLSTCTPPPLYYSPTRHPQWLMVAGVLLTSETKPQLSQELCQPAQEGGGHTPTPTWHGAPRGGPFCRTCHPTQPHLACGLRAVGGDVGRGAQDTESHCQCEKGSHRVLRCAIQALLMFQKS